MPESLFNFDSQLASRQPVCVDEQDGLQKHPRSQIHVNKMTQKFEAFSLFIGSERQEVTHPDDSTKTTYHAVIYSCTHLNQSISCNASKIHRNI